MSKQKKQNKRNIKSNRKKLQKKSNPKNTFRPHDVFKNVPNYHSFDTKLGEGGFFTNPNPEGGIKATEMLNELAKVCEDKVFTSPKVDNSKLNSYFELNPLNFKWNYFIDYLDSRLVMEEVKDNIISVFMYFGDKNKFRADYDTDLRFESADILSLTVAGFLDAATASKKGVEFSMQTA